MVAQVRRLLLVLPLLVVAAPAAADDGVHPVKEHVDLTLVKRSGSSKYEHKGRATGTVDGTVTSKITIRHTIALSGSVTIKTSKGSVRMTVKGTATSVKMRTPIKGTAKIVGGTGKYEGAIGSGTFKGMVNRSTWHVTLDATGSYHY